MKRFVRLISCISLAITVVILAGCGTASDYTKQIGAASFLMDGSYTTLEDDAAVAYIMTHTTGTGYEIGDEDKVSVEDVRNYMSDASQAFAFYNDGSWGEVRIYPTDYKSKELKEYVDYFFEGFNFDESEIIKTENGLKVFKGKYDNGNGATFYRIIAIKYGIAFEAAVCENEELATQIIETLDFNEDDMGYTTRYFEEVAYEVPDNYIDYQAGDGWHECCFYDNDKKCSITMYSYDNKTDYVNAESNLLSSVDVVSEEIIETSIGDVEYIQANMGKNFLCYEASFEYNGKYYNLSTFYDTDALKELLLTLEGIE